MTELVRSIPGPGFLVLLWGCSFLALFLHARLLEKVNTPAPDAQAPLTPLQLGYLARGKRGLIETALVMAEQEGIVRIDSDTKLISLVDGAKPRHGSSKELLDELTESKGSLQTLSLNNTVESVRSSLENRGLLGGDAPLLRIAIGIAIYGPILATAITKLQLGWHRGRPIFFLALSLLVLGVTMLLKTFGSVRKGVATPSAKRILEKRRKL
ncbi:MAG: TIGR04222 domain-containing membrane protein, partial [Fibrobacterota bacterium]